MKSVTLHLGIRSWPGDEGDRDLGDMSILSHEEGLRVASICERRAKWGYVTAHRLIRQMLEKAYQSPASSWMFTRGANGKPHLSPEHSARPADFNVSHTRDMVACVLAGSEVEADGLLLGVDVEHLDRKVNALPLAERFCAEDEYAWLCLQPSEAQSEGFIRLWTLKEAVAKATGLGLQMGFHAFSCTIDPPAVKLNPASPFAERHWQMYTIISPSRHCLSIAVGSPEPLSIRWQVDSDHGGAFSMAGTRDSQ